MDSGCAGTANTAARGTCCSSRCMWTALFHPRNKYERIVHLMPIKTSKLCRQDNIQNPIKVQKYGGCLRPDECRSLFGDTTCELSRQRRRSACNLINHTKLHRDGCGVQSLDHTRWPKPTMSRTASSAPNAIDTIQASRTVSTA